MRYQRIFGHGARLGLLLAMAMAAGTIHAQNQTPANESRNDVTARQQEEERQRAARAEEEARLNASRQQEEERRRAAEQAQTVAAPANASEWPAVVWKDLDTGLMWATTDNGFNVTQKEAVKCCRNLDLGGFRDWRLPGIDELAGIYDRSVVSGILSDGIRLHIKGGIQMTDICSWSATAGSASREAWDFDFAGGDRDSYRLDGSNDRRALCVRRSVEGEGTRSPAPTPR
jgi:hypothetical protein